MLTYPADSDAASRLSEDQPALVELLRLRSGFSVRSDKVVMSAENAPECSRRSAISHEAACAHITDVHFNGRGYSNSAGSARTASICEMIVKSAC